MWVKSASLEVVYCAAAARWAQQFLAEPWGRGEAEPGAGPPLAYAHVRDQTKARLITQWEHMLHPHLVTTTNKSNAQITQKSSIVSYQSYC